MADGVVNRRIDVFSPHDGSLLGHVEVCGSSEVDAAVGRASRAFDTWGRTPVKERVQPLFRFKQIIEHNLAELAKLVSSENGKLPAEAAAGIERGLEVVEFACSMPQLFAGEILEVSSGVSCHTSRFPLGVTAGITPFNFPAMVPMWMYPMSIACGNTFLLKPSEQTPLTSIRIAELLMETGLPENVFQVVQGDRETVEALLDHPDIQAVTFVGSTPVAKAVHARGVAAGKRVLALGGAKNHLVVVPDADVELTAKNIVSSFTGCAGQRCMAASVLIFVGENHAIMDAIVHHASRLQPGKDLGAIISKIARDRIVSYICKAESEGAELRLDGRNPLVVGKESGYYVGPSVLEGLKLDSACIRDEIFGPVLSVLHVGTLDEAIAISNATPYGNAASIFTSSGAVARYFEQHATAGMIGVNIGVPVPRDPFPFGGWNASKFGDCDITGSDAVAFWTKAKKVTSKWSAGSGANWMS